MFLPLLTARTDNLAMVVELGSAAPPGMSCTDAFGATIPDGSSVLKYSTPSVACSSTCASETRVCTNGVLSGTFQWNSCGVFCFNQVASAQGCSVTFGNGQYTVSVPSAEAVCQVQIFQAEPITLPICSFEVTNTQAPEIVVSLNGVTNSLEFVSTNLPTSATLEISAFDACAKKRSPLSKRATENLVVFFSVQANIVGNE